MNQIQIDTTQNISLNFEPGSLGDRILARLLDGAVIIVYIILVWTMIALASISYATWLVIVLALPVVFYDLVAETSFNGQSIGKRVLKIKVISLDGNRPTLGQYLIRWLFRLVDFTLTQSFCAVLCVAISQKHQRLGDMVAGTAVIKIDPPVVFDETIYTPVNEDYQVQFPEAANLTSKDIRLIKEVLLYHSKQYHLLLLDNTADKIKDLLHIQTAMDPYNFLHTILTDYNYMESRV